MPWWGPVGTKQLRRASSPAAGFWKVASRIGQCGGTNCPPPANNRLPPACTLLGQRERQLQIEGLGLGWGVVGVPGDVASFGRDLGQ